MPSGDHKHGRNKEHCKAYRGRKQREKNKLLRLKRHLKYQGFNSVTDSPKEVQIAWKKLESCFSPGEFKNLISGKNK